MLWNAKNGVLRVGDTTMDYIRFGNGDRVLIILPGLGDGLNEEERTDFPWVKVFGETASECMKRLRTGSQIYASCAFQTRDVERHVKCQNCEQVLVYEERVGEIVPNSVEFLNNCLFEDTVKNPNQTKKNNKWKKNKWKKKHRKGAGNEKKI